MSFLDGVANLVAKGANAMFGRLDDHLYMDWDTPLTDIEEEQEVLESESLWAAEQRAAAAMFPQHTSPGSPFPAPSPGAPCVAADSPSAPAGQPTSLSETTIRQIVREEMERGLATVVALVWEDKK